MLDDLHEKLENNLLPVDKSDNFDDDNISEELDIFVDDNLRSHNELELFAGMVCQPHSGMARTVLQAGLQRGNHAGQHQTRAGTKHRVKARLSVVQWTNQTERAA